MSPTRTTQKIRLRSYYTLL